MVVLKGVKRMILKIILPVLAVVLFVLLELLTLMIYLHIVIPVAARCYSFSDRFPRNPETGVMIGAEAFSFKRGPTGCLLLHGFGGAPEEMRGLGEYLANNGITIICPRLKGYGTDPWDLNNATCEIWLEEAEIAFQELKKQCERVYVVGFSLGGFLSISLAKNHKDEVESIALLGTALTIFTDPSFCQRVRFYTKFASFFSPILGKWDIAYIRDPEAKARRRGYKYFTKSGALESLRACEHARAALPSLSGKKFLLVNTTLDPSEKVARRAIRRLVEMIPSEPKLVTAIEVNNSGHVITVDYDKETVFNAVLNFIQGNTTDSTSDTNLKNIPINQSTGGRS